MIKSPNKLRPDNSSSTSNPLENALIASLRPYFLAILMLALAFVVMYFGDRFLLRYGFPWVLISLLVVGTVANLYGVRPAILVVLLSALFGDLIVPDLHISYFYGQGTYSSVRVIRMLLFVACGLSFVWLTYKVRQIQARADRRWRVVEALQRMVVPDRLDHIPGYDAFGFYSPALHEEEVGGDFYDLYQLGDGSFGILIGDVVGKGKEAVAYTAMLRYSVRALAGAGSSPGQILHQINNLVETQKLSLGTATMFVGVLNPPCGTLHYASAGHEPALLIRERGATETLDATGPVIGAGIDFTYEENSVLIGPADALLLMTDGVTEARNDQRQFLYSEGVAELLRPALSSASAEGAVRTLQQAVLDFIGDNSRDDIALLLLLRNSDPSAPVEAKPRSLSGFEQANVDFERAKNDRNKHHHCGKMPAT